jgi:DNA-directed RNA polymerase subunit H (RpoH/RPB5)
MEILFEKYKNIQKFITQYRKYNLVDDNFYDFKTFKKTIQIEQYVKHICINNKTNKLVYIYIFITNSKYIKTTAQFKRLIDKIPNEPTNVIVISKNPLSIYINKAMVKYEHLKIFNYLYKNFSIEISKGPFCSKHTILSNNEVRTLCSRDLIIHPLSLPAISINDPQNIWIGGELGDVIRINSISEITGKTIRYRIVSPTSGKIVNLQKINKKLNANIPTKEQLTKNITDGVKVEAEQEQEFKNKEIDDDISLYIDDDDDDDDDYLL